MAALEIGTSPGKLRQGLRVPRSDEMGPCMSGLERGKAPGWLGRDSDGSDVQSIERQGYSLWKFPGHKPCKTTISFHVAPVHYGFFSLLQLPVCGQQLCGAWL